MIVTSPYCLTYSCVPVEWSDTNIGGNFEILWTHDFAKKLVDKYKQVFCLKQLGKGDLIYPHIGFILGKKMIYNFRKRDPLCMPGLIAHDFDLSLIYTDTLQYVSQYGII